MRRESPFRRYRRFWGADPKRDVDEELAFHLDMRADEYRRAGLSDDAARLATTKRFGDVDEIRHEVESLAVRRHHRRRRSEWLDATLNDIRFAVRTLAKNPGYALAMILTLGLGIGANAAAFSVAYGVLLRPLPYADAGRLVRIWSRLDRAKLEFFSVAPRDFDDWRTQAKTITAAAAFERQHDATLGVERPRSVSVTSVTPSVFALLGVRPIMGRALSDDDARAGAPATAVISHQLWTTEFGGDSGIVGRDVLVNGHKVTVVGVMPPRFSVPGTDAEVWFPLRSSLEPDQRDSHYLRVLARLAPSATPEMVAMELNRIVARTERSLPAAVSGWTTNVMTVREMIIGSDFRAAVLVLVGVVAFVLVIACANAAGLQLARAVARRREVALRIALGASAGRVVRQLLTESTLIASLAGLLGLALGFGGVAILRATGSTMVPRLDDVRIDAPVLWFTAAAAMASGILFGIAPALRALDADLVESLKLGGRSGGASVTGRLRGTFVVVEISLSLVLLIGAGLLIRTLERLQDVRTGFDDRGLVVARTQLPEAAYQTLAAASVQYEMLLDRVSAQPGVQSAALVSAAPFAGPNTGLVFLPTDMTLAPGAPSPGGDYREVSNGYFRTMHIRLVRGRDIEPTDREGSPPVVVVSASLARAYWPQGDAIGKRIRIRDVVDGPVVTIVGIVDDVRYQSLEEDAPRPMLYFSWYSSPERGMTIVARTSTPAAAANVSAALAAADRRLPPPAVATMESLVRGATAAHRFAVTLFSIFAALAVVLALVGLYGLLSYLVNQRGHELGIRAALGARPARLVSMVVAGAVGLTAAGVIVGLAAAYGLTRFLRSLLVGVSATDGPTFIGFAMALAVVALTASAVPAWRAARTDPMRALRDER